MHVYILLEGQCSLVNRKLASEQGKSEFKSCVKYILAVLPWTSYLISHFSRQLPKLERKCQPALVEETSLSRSFLH